MFNIYIYMVNIYTCVYVYIYISSLPCLVQHMARLWTFLGAVQVPQPAADLPNAFSGGKDLRFPHLFWSELKWQSWRCQPTTVALNGVLYIQIYIYIYIHIKGYYESMQNWKQVRVDWEYCITVHVHWRIGAHHCSGSQVTVKNGLQFWRVVEHSFFAYEMCI